MLFECLSYITGAQKFHSSNGVGLDLAWGGSGLDEDIMLELPGTDNLYSTVLITFPLVLLV